MSAAAGPHASVRADVVTDGAVYGPYRLAPIARVVCSAVGQFFYNTNETEVMNGFTPVQHNYPKNPLPTACRISSFFDKYRGGKAHRALDVVFNDPNNQSQVPPVGTPVTAMEDGIVVGIQGGLGPAATPYPGCQGSPGNYVKLQGGDGYSTIYFHMSPAAGIGYRTPVTAGQVIGYLDTSGCQTKPPLHVGRKDPAGNLVNFTIPCVNPTPNSLTFYEDYSAEDDDPTDW